MVGCCVPTPLYTAPTPSAFVRRHTILSSCPSLSSPDNDDSGSSAGGRQGTSARCA
jgi:hypothetical protein